MKTQKKIVILEDDVQYHSVLFTALKQTKQHLSVEVFGNYVDLLNYLQALPPNQLPSLLVFNHELKTINVSDFVKMLTCIEEYKDLPFIVYTSKSPNQVHAQYQDLNAVAVLEKQTNSQKVVEQLQFICQFAET